MKPQAIALTGGIGCGKTTFSNYLHKSHQIPLIDYDKISKALLKPGSLGVQKVIELFGKTFVDDRGQINRNKLRIQIFNNPHLKLKLEQYLHPLIRQVASKKFQHYLENRKSPYCLAIIPLLGLTNYMPRFLQHILVIQATYHQQHKCLKKRDQLSLEITKKMTAQQSFSRKRFRKLSAYPCTRIFNNQGIEQLHKRAEYVHRAILEYRIQLHQVI